jgi:hypothetical protein
MLWWPVLPPGPPEGCSSDRIDVFCSVVVNPARIDGKSYSDVVSTLATLSKTRRLAPLTRADAGSHAHTPAHEGSALHEAQGATAR